MQVSPWEPDKLRGWNANCCVDCWRISRISLYRAMYQHVWHKMVTTDRIYFLNCHELCILVYLVHYEWLRLRHLSLLLKTLPRFRCWPSKVSLPHCPRIRWEIQRQQTGRSLQMDFVRRITWLLAWSFPSGYHGNPLAEAITWDLLDASYCNLDCMVLLHAMLYWR